MATVTLPPEQLAPGSDGKRRPERKGAGLVRVALFCGGRGSASLIRELLRWPDVHLSVVVNAYDDGLSTGELRSLVPDMLGPSDFRKNLARLLNPHSNEQYALRRLLDHRFATNFSAVDIDAFERFVTVGQGWLPEPLGDLFADLNPRLRAGILGYLRRFFEYQHHTEIPFSYADSSLGNLVFAGAYLDTNRDFNASIQKITALCSSRAELINVSRGENRTLVALKADGEILWRESAIVGPQSATPIREFFLLEHPCEEEIKQEIDGLSVEEKSRRLRSLHCDVQLSAEADFALRNADLILYGPGTQFSSLLPSYCTKGIAEAIAASRAGLKIFVPNLDCDHDIQSLSASDLADKTLETLGAPDNNNLITHILYNAASNTRPAGIKLGRMSEPFYKGAAVIAGRFESSAKPGTHSGYGVISKALSLLEAGNVTARHDAVEVYVDLLDRSRALEPLMEEFLDLPWDEQFGRVTLRLNRMRKAAPKLPAYASIVPADFVSNFTEVDALMNWLAHGDTEYLVTLTGDGEYRLSDALLGIQFLKQSSFGVVYGSRTQSRRQFHSALDSAYGERPWLRFFSWCGTFVFTALIGLLFRLIFSDPLTGFRIYRRSKLPESFVAALLKRAPSTAGTVTSLLIRHNIEIAEIPVTYRTFRGFTRANWRVFRGVRNLLGVLG